jgi:LCP family protein required for cell wall assembly
MVQRLDQGSDARRRPRSSRPGRRSGPPDTFSTEGLERLGDEINASDRGRRPGSTEGLERLGDQIKAGRRGAGAWSAAGSGAGAPPGGPPPGSPPPGGPPGGPPVVVPPRKRKPKRSRGQRIFRWSLVSLAILLVAVGSLYGYVRWKLGEIKSIHCTACSAVAAGAPYNVLIVGSDSRAGDTGQAAKSFGSASSVGGQRSDTIKILHVVPATHTARLLSIPRDTYVQLSGMPAGTGLSTDNKINTAFNNGIEPLISTIQSTFGIPIAHFVTIDFNGVINLVDAVGGISLDFKYPVKDDDNGNNNSGLNIPTTGCQVLNGNMALALARSRFYTFYADGYWQQDPAGDLGRIQRQNTVIESVIDKVKGTVNPLRLNSFLDAVVHDITKDDALSATGLISLAQNYHAFSGSDLQTFTLPTTGAQTPYGSDVEVVNQPQALQTLTQFLGQAPNPVTTPPIDAYGEAIPVPTTTVPAPAPSSGSSAPPPSRPPTATTKPPTTTLPSYDPTPC